MTHYAAAPAILLLLGAAVLCAAPLSPRLDAGRDTSVAVWVIFRDRDGTQRSVTRRALARRARRGHAGALAGRDRSVSEVTVRAVTDLDARRRAVFPWANAASFEVHASRLPRIAALPAVAAVVPVRTFPAAAGGLDKRSAPPPSWGVSRAQFDMVGITRAHTWLDGRGAAPGEGVVIAFFDAGFPLWHRCFDRLRANHLVLADSDFVDRDGEVDYNDRHGAQTLSLCAGYDPGSLVGAAWNARYVLARTEETIPERHVEEDYWMAALVWAESLGVDIVSSSLGYRYEFDPPETDYSFADMDGRATTISATAARYATELGMVIVNSMGNDASQGIAGTLNAPADAEGVVGVGAVDGSGYVASFSSRGPTADGRIKPDLVAPGVRIWVPFPDSSNTYTQGDGTSFSAPIVAGACALILQAHPDVPADLIRRYLYASCRLLPWQDTVDNTYGRGLPDAELACRLQADQVVIHARDSAGVSLPGIPVGDASGPRGLTDSAGTSILSMDQQSLPATLTVGDPRSEGARAVTVTETPARITVDMGYLRAVVRLVDTTTTPETGIAGAAVYWRAAGASAWLHAIADSAGWAAIYYATAGAYEVYGAADGYFTPKARNLDLRTVPDTNVIALKPRSPKDFIVYPTVVRLSSPSPTLKYAFVATDAGTATRRVRLTLRTGMGLLVWQGDVKVIDTYGPVTGTIDLRRDVNARLTPGAYLFLMQYGATMRQRKILILG